VPVDRPGPWRHGASLVERVLGFRRLRVLVPKRETQLIDLLSLAEGSDAAAELACRQFQALPVKVRRHVWKRYVDAQRAVNPRNWFGRHFAGSGSDFVVGPLVRNPPEGKRTTRDF